MAITDSGQPEWGRIIFPTSRDSVPDRIKKNVKNAPEVAQIITIGIGSLFVHLSRFRYRCVISDPLGLNEGQIRPASGETDRGPHPA